MDQSSKAIIRSTAQRLSQPASADAVRPAPASSIAPPAKPGNFNFPVFVRATLRGRYWIVVTLGILVGIGAGLLAWRFGRPVYQSDGLIQIAYSLPEVSGETDQNKPMGGMFNAFMQSQKTLITSRRVIEMAIVDPAWKAMGRQAPPNPDRWFAENLTVDIKPSSEIIRIIVTDYDPATAAAAATSVVNAYQEIYGERERLLHRKRMGTLEDRQSDLQLKIDGLNKQIDAVARARGTTDLKPFIEDAATRVSKLQYSLAEIRAAIDVASKAQPAAGGVKEPGKKAEPLTVTPDQAARTDPVMRGLLVEQEQKENALEKYRLAYGDAHSTIVNAKHELEMVKRRIAKQLASYQYQAVTAQSLDDPRNLPIATAGKSLDVLRENEASLEKLLADLSQEMKAMGKDQIELQRIQVQLDVYRSELNKYALRLDTLRTENTMGSRLTVFSTGDIPLSPSKDPRLKLAAGAGLSGALLPATLIVGLSFLRRRFRYSDDAAAHGTTMQVPLLGILPELREGRMDQEDVMGAAHSVHQIRVSLQAQQGASGGRAFLVTSAAAGEGKTSLTLSLGLSFALARQRTLVIDCDLVGRRLTGNLNAHDADGLREAIDAGSLRGLLRRTQAGLYVLTAGRKADARDAYAIPGDRVRTLLDEARTQFDVILIDSGPVLGSVEAAVVAREVDGVIFAVSRGQSQRLVGQALSRLSGLGVRIMGLIFNRARAEDFRGSSYSSSHRSTAPAGSQLQGLADCGPLDAAPEPRRP